MSSADEQSQPQPVDHTDRPQADAGPAARPRRSRLIKVVVASALALLLVVVPSIEYVLLASRSPRIDISFPTTSVSGDTWVIVGLDDRAEAADATNGDFGNGAKKPVGGRADVVVVVRPGVGAINISRDLLFFDAQSRPLLLTNTWQTSPQLFVNTLCTGLGIAVTGVVAVDMRGFQTVVDELGGIEVTIPEARRDRRTGLNLKAGTQTIDGRTALALVRTRQGEVYRNGAWVLDPEAQAGREARAGQVLALVVAKAKAKVSRDPLLAHRLGWKVLPDVTRDSDNSLLSLAALRSVKVDASLPVHRIPDAQMSEPNEQSAAALAKLGITGDCTPTA